MRLAPLLAVLLAVLLAACGDDPAGPNPEASTIFALVSNADELDRLEALVRETELASTLQMREGLTLFAPTDLALERLGPDMLARLAGNPDVLLKVLRRHIVAQPLRTEDLHDGDTLTPLEGPPLPVRVEDGEVFVGGARLTARRSDFETGTGLVHYVDDVVRDHLTLSERLRVTPLAADFAALFSQAGLDDLLGGEPYTLLIPIDNAFDALGGQHIQELLRFANRDVLLKVLRHHVLPGRVRLEDLAEAEALTPLDGSPLSVEEADGVHYLGGARVIAAEVETSDGLIYLLDRIVLTHLDLAERIQVHPHLTTYRALLDAAGVLDQLRTDGPYTVFLPPDAALTGLGEGFVPALQARPDQLLLTAEYAVAEGTFYRAALLEGGSLPTLSGHQMPVATSNEPGGPVVFVGGGSVVGFPPVEAANGLLYTISPFAYPQDISLEGQAVFFGLHRFLGLMEQAGLASLLRGDEPYTLFAPTDQAFSGVQISPGQLPDVLRAHIVEGAHPTSEVLDGPTLTSLAGTPISVGSAGPAGIQANGVLIQQYAERPRNGVIYTLDDLLP